MMIMHAVFHGRGEESFKGHSLACARPDIPVLEQRISRFYKPRRDILLRRCTLRCHPEPHSSPPLPLDAPLAHLLVRLASHDRTTTILFSRRPARLRAAARWSRDSVRYALFSPGYPYRDRSLVRSRERGAVSPARGGGSSRGLPS